MRKLLTLSTLFSVLIPFAAMGQDLPGSSSSVAWKIFLDPATVGFRFDDNVYRSVMDSGRLTDGIVSADWGGLLRADYDVFKAYLDYHLGDDQYLSYTELNNLKNDINLLLAVQPAEWNFYYKFDYFIRDSQYFDFDYFDVNSLAGAKWTPNDSWSYEAQYKNLARQYYDTSVTVWSKNFVDQSGALSVEKEIDDRFTIKLLGSYTDREFNRYALANNSGVLSSLSTLQNDDTWKILLNAHIYFASILQDINIEGERTDSNSYGFSNSVQSVSWAGVIRPTSGFYLQLLFRLYIKTYDVAPLTLSTEQLGFTDEDGQDLLAVKANWDIEQDWVGSLGFSRMRTESDQPGAYYIKDIISAQIRRSF